MNICEIIAQDLRGHAYVAARGLTPPFKRPAPLTWKEMNDMFNEMLPSIQAVCQAELKRQLAEKHAPKLRRVA